MLSLTLGGLTFVGPAWSVVPSSGCAGSWDVDSGAPPLIGSEAIACQMKYNFWN
ncbi:MAG: hypothetical protein AABW51_05135 [Nanoarchaeota archaeon]